MWYRGIGLLLSVSVAHLAGCGRSYVHPPDSAEGLFERHCAECHAQAGQPGGPPGVGSSKGPKLDKIGAAKGRDVDYFIRFIRDPRSVRAEAKLMPAFGEELTAKEIRTLAEFLAGKKGESSSPIRNP
jgi:mono/diheme cytochrome c family protein